MTLKKILAHLIWAQTALFCCSFFIVPVFVEINISKDMSQMSEFMEQAPEGKPVDMPQKQNFEDVVYDFIVVGSGSSGSVIASRLTENPQWKVLLLEIGEGESKLGLVPLFAPFLQFTEYNWAFETEPNNKSCLGMIGGRCAWPRGRALGGTTAINYMIYSRGNRDDFDSWARQGSPSWSYDYVLDYFKKSERADLPEGQPDKHGTQGPLGVQNSYFSSLTQSYLDAWKELNYKNVDYNSGDQDGYSRIQATLQRGRRHSAARAFLQPIRKRPNLTVVTGAWAWKILLSPSARKAYGVKVVKNRQKYKVRASKEVIIACGALMTPHLLMLSGIGPGEHLTEMGIKVFQDLPVGQNLRDHLGYVGMTFTVNETVAKAADLLDPAQIHEWYATGKGHLSSLGGVEAIGYIRTKQQYNPDVSIIFLGGGSLHTDYGLINRRGMRISDEVYNETFQPLEDHPSWTAIPVLLRPKSKGYIKLRSKNPNDYPLFYPNYLDNDQDVEKLLTGIRFIQHLGKTEAFRKFGSTLSDVPVRGCEGELFDSDQYWRCSIRVLSTSIHHQYGTCKMGPKSDPTTVVNEYLKVHGVQGLRVADSSIIPGPMTGHTSAVTIMVGEKVSDMIKKEYQI